MNNDLREACEREVNTILTKRDWKLEESRTDFVARTLLSVEVSQRDAVRPLPQINAIRLAIFRCYGATLHEACSQAGLTRQQRAFIELAAYLYPIMLKRLGDASRSEECLQRTLEAVWRKLATCRDPQSFLKWAQIVALNQIRDMLKDELRTESSMAGQLPDDGDPQNPADDIPAPPAPIRGLGDDAVRLHVERAIQSCLAHNQNQQRVIIELFLNERSVKETADLLKINVGHVAVLKHRALAVLRTCDDFLDAISDWLDTH
ncbi:MAG: sigma-70 family RNA polymerase sigma factor [Chloroflexi bacterium]|nr:sigma-70 family RNA polymerase sigma factor [Chloroflexota bacterium]